jgi:fructuronate reductase
LYTIVSRGLDVSKVTVIGSLLDIVLTSDEEDGTCVIERMADPTTRIVSLTLTEKGYHADLRTRALNLHDEAVVHDLEHPDETPKSAVGLIVRSLAVRQTRGIDPFTVLSCDNIPSNGDFARTMTMDFIKATGDTDLLTWAETKCTFPNSMVGMSFLSSPKHF